jgi:hypothetical protein
MSYGQLVILRYYDHTDAVYHKEYVIDIIYFFEIVHTTKFKLECVEAP